MPINCAALPEGLLGDAVRPQEGSFTGADATSPDSWRSRTEERFSSTTHGIFVADQAKLLRVLQDGVVRRVGSEQQDAVVDVRFISATNRDPAECVTKGTLREDLLYRLRVVPIKLPPLRKRLEDIPLLANHFLTHFWERHRQPGEPSPRLTEASIDFLRSRPWRGNVRELQNVIEQLAVLAEPARGVRPADVPLDDASCTIDGNHSSIS